MVIQLGVPFHPTIPGGRPHHTPSKKLFGLVIQDPVGEVVSKIGSNANPSSRAFFGGGPAIFRIEVEDFLPETELEVCRDITSDTTANS